MKVQLLLAGWSLLVLTTNSTAGEVVLQGNHTLARDQRLNSPNKRFTLVMQGDGNLVLYYDPPNGKSGMAVWESGTTGSGAVQASMQLDGNFVVYAPKGKAKWACGTLKGTATPELRLADSGRLYVKAGDKERQIRGAMYFEKAPITMARSKQRMEYKVKLSENGTIETWREASIKKQSGNWHHRFVFQLLDENGNTVYASDVETLTLGAKTDIVGRPEDYTKREREVYRNRISSADAAKVRFIYLEMEQREGGKGSLTDQIKDARRIFEDTTGVTVKDAVKAGMKAIAGSGG